MKGIYLASHKALHETHDIIYQDINGKRDIGGDMMDVDLTPYDFIIATPPCNYYSRANYRRETSEYSQKTKHLLPDIIDKLILLGKPFIVENDKNKKLFTKCGLLNKKCNIYFIGRHTYWTNLNFDLEDVELMNLKQLQDVKNRNSVEQYARTKRQGGKDVHEVIEYFIGEVSIVRFEEHRKKVEKELLSSLGIDEKDYPKNERVLVDEKSDEWAKERLYGMMMQKEYYSIKKLDKLGNAKIIIPAKKEKPLVALGYLNDIAHGRKTQYDPQFLKVTIEQSLLAFELIKQCFTLNGFDELIPNENWWVSESIQNFVKRMLK